MHGNERWSPYGAPWLQPVAISGKSRGRKNRRNKPKPLPWVATGCLQKYMVRRGSTVRVRQRAPEKSRKAGLSVSDALRDPQRAVGMGPLWSLQVENALVFARNDHFPRSAHRVGVAGQVDQLPDFVLAQHREERGREEHDPVRITAPPLLLPPWWSALLSTGLSL